MKNFFLIPIAFLILILINNYDLKAEYPKIISFQGLLTEKNTGNALPDGTYTVKFTIFDKENGGNAVWTEEHQITTYKGVFDVLLGTNTPLDLPFDRPYWLGIVYENTEFLNPRVPFTTVPYSFYADTANIAQGLSPNATGAVLTLNGLAGRINITGDSKIGVTTNGNNVELALKGQSIDTLSSLDGTMEIVNPYGPHTMIGIKDGSITTGKLDPNIKIPLIGDAGGDLAGTYPNPTIAQKGAKAGDVLKWNGTSWQPANDELSTLHTNAPITGDGTMATPLSLSNTTVVPGLYGSTTQSATFTVDAKGRLTGAGNVTISGTVPGGSAGGDLTGIYPNPVIAQKGALNGQVLTWNGTSWVPQDDDGLTAVAVSNPLAGDGTPLNPIQLLNTPVDPGMYGSATQVPQFFVDQKGRITTASNITIAGTAPGGPAGGDLAGTYPNPTIAQKGASNGQVLIWNGSAWVPESTTNLESKVNVTARLTGDGTTTNPLDLANTSVTAGNYGSATQVGTFTVDTQGRLTNAGNVTISGTTPGGAAGGDLTGTYPNPTIAQNGATNGQVLIWNGSAWVPESTTNLQAKVSTNAPITGDGTTGSPLGLANTSVTAGNYGSATQVGTFTVDAQGRLTNAGNVTITGTVPNGTASDQILVWNGSAWVPADPTTTESKVSVTARLTGDGTTTNPLDLANTSVTAGNYGSATQVGTFTVDAQGRLTNAGNVTISGTTPGGAAGGDLAGTYPNPTIAQKGATNGQVLIWNGSAWVPESTTNLQAKVSTNAPITGDGTTGSPLGLANTSVTAGNYGSATQVGTFTVDAQGRLTNAGNVTISGTTPGGAAGGDLTGTYPNPTIAQKGATNGQVLIWNGSAWVPESTTNLQAKV
ncbi:hypothetical protein D9V86_03725, partial [Bacteroidetes/Chlorobi group bacterium ChocPot_Mid]